MVEKSSPILVDGRLYQCDVDQNNLYIVDAAKGKLIKKEKLLGQIIRGSPLYADGKIYICSTTAWHVFRPTAKGVEVVQKMALRAPEDEMSASVVVSHGRLYVATGARLYCLGKEGQKPAATPIPPQPVEPAVADDDAPAQLQVVPAELLLKSGAEQQFHVRLFNSRGQFLREVPTAAFTLDGPGEIDKTGLYKANKNSEHTATILKAKVGALSGESRIRVVPPLPWKFDFQKTPLVANPKNPKAPKAGEPPVTLGSERRSSQRGRRTEGARRSKSDGQGDHDSEGYAQSELDGPDRFARLHGASRCAGRRRRSENARYRLDCPTLHAGDAGSRSGIADSLLASASGDAIFRDDSFHLEAEQMVYAEVPRCGGRWQSHIAGKDLAP